MDFDNYVEYLRNISNKILHGSVKQILIQLTSADW